MNADCVTGGGPAALPVLRAPPFPGSDASVSVVHAKAQAPLPEPDMALFAQIRSARVGGAFWATATSDPWQELARGAAIEADGDDERVALARFARLPVKIRTPGRFGTPLDDAATLDRKAMAGLLAARYRDPFSGHEVGVAETVALLAEWRRIFDANAAIAAACGIAWWKRSEIRRFLYAPGRRLTIARRSSRALQAARAAGGAIAVWPSRVSVSLRQAARSSEVALVQVEDGFIRSVGLGSNLVPPSSIVVDRRGIHFDPSGPSDLEALLAETEFDPALLSRAKRLRADIIAAGISKYAAGTGPSDASSRKENEAFASGGAPTAGQRIVLVPGQVEDDMSVLAGGGGLTSNLELLRRVRLLEPDADIWWRPHPDVDAGHRKGAIADHEALRHADRIVRHGAMVELLDSVDAVHVLTSLTGFEALLRGREVTCHGTPFYAGWGLTRDLGAVPHRRGRQLELDALVAAVLILYPRYLDPVTGLPCPVEVLVGRMATGECARRRSWVSGLRQWQGRFRNRIP